MKKIFVFYATFIMLCCMLYTSVDAAAPSGYEGKIVSILGDSISTFEGYIPKGDGTNLNHMTTYPSDALRLTVEDTWWMQVINQLGAKLGINESWAGTRIANFDSRNVGIVGKDVCMASVTRIKNLGSNGTPDVILFYGGTNDVGKRSELGSFDPATAPKEVDLEAVIWPDFAQAYTAAIMRMQHFYPDAKIYALLPNATEYHNHASFAPYIEVMEAVCEHYDVPTVDLRESGIELIHLPDGTHPDATGMDIITEQVLKTMSHTHEFVSADSKYHICDCGMKAVHELNVVKESFGAEKTECTVCEFTHEKASLFPIICICAAATLVIVITVTVVISKKKKI